MKVSWEYGNHYHKDIGEIRMKTCKRLMSLSWKIRATVSEMEKDEIFMNESWVMTASPRFHKPIMKKKIRYLSQGCHERFMNNIRSDLLWFSWKLSWISHEYLMTSSWTHFNFHETIMKCGFSHEAAMNLSWTCHDSNFRHDSFMTPSWKVAASPYVRRGDIFSEYLIQILVI